MRAADCLLWLSFLVAPLSAQDEDDQLPWLPCKDAFEKAASQGRRVLVYQDWPG